MDGKRSTLNFSCKSLQGEFTWVPAVTHMMCEYGKYIFLYAYKNVLKIHILYQFICPRTWDIVIFSHSKRYVNVYAVCFYDKPLLFTYCYIIIDNIFRERQHDIKGFV